jgi:hypothetical protein
MYLASHDETSGLGVLWSTRAALLAEAGNRQAQGDGAATDTALSRAMELSHQMTATPARTLSEAALKLELALEEVEIAYGDEADPAWARLRQAFNETRVRAAA